MKIERNRDSLTQLAESTLEHLLFLTNLPVLGALTFLPVLPGCDSPVQDIGFTISESGGMVKLEVRESAENISFIDALVFEDDETMILDSFQRLPYIAGEDVDIGSSEGQKVVFMCANPQWESSHWYYIYSFAGLEKTKATLEKERRDSPLMTGTQRITAGEDGGGSIGLRRLRSEIRIDSFSYDFSGKPYDGEKIEEMRAYLINVNASCSITADGEIIPERIINQGRLIDADVNGFHEKGIIVQDLSGDSNNSDISLLCYPNCSGTESIGTPCTRLVIEGRIGNDIWYWPINVKVARNCTYSYRIRITGKGSTDPDIPVSHNILETDLEVMEWEGKEEYSVSF